MLYCLLRNYLQCKDIDYIIFTYGFHGERKAIFDEVLHRLEEEKINFECYMIILNLTSYDHVARLFHDYFEMFP